MTPEDIDQLKRLKQLLDDGVLTTEEFELQKNVILSTPQNTELTKSEGQGGIFSPEFFSNRVINSDPKNLEVSESEETEAVKETILSASNLFKLTWGQNKMALLVLFVGVLVAGSIFVGRGNGSDSGDIDSAETPDSIVQITELTEAALFVGQVEEAHVEALSEVFVLSGDLIREKARLVGLDLYDIRISQSDQVASLAETLIDTKDELMYSAKSRITANVYTFFRRPLDISATIQLCDKTCGTDYLNNNAVALRRKFDANALMQEDVIQFLSDQQQAFIAYYNGDAIKAESEFARMLGFGGASYSQKGGALEGLEAIIITLATIDGKNVLQGYISESRTGATRDLTELVTSNGLAAGKQLNLTPELLQQGIAKFDDELRMRLETFATGDLTTPNNQRLLTEFLTATQIWAGKLAFNNLEIDQSSINALRDTLANSTPEFKKELDEFYEARSITAPTEAPTAPPIEGSPTDYFLHLRVEEACGIVRKLQYPNGNNSDSDLVYLTDLAESIWEGTLQNEQYGLPKSKYEEFGQSLKVSMETFNERVRQYMPLSLSNVFEQCDLFGW
jgi:hypothetical protein